MAAVFYICGYDPAEAPICRTYDAKGGKGLDTLKIPTPAMPLHYLSSQSLTTDSAGNIYTTPGADNIYVYSPGAKTLLQMLQNPGEQTLAVAGTSQLVVAANAAPFAQGTGQLTVYKNGGAQPSYYLGDGMAQHGATGITLDAKGNCYLSYESSGSGNGGIDRFASCAQNSTPYPIAVAFCPSCDPSQLWNPVFDRRGNLHYLAGNGTAFSCKGTSQCAQNSVFASSIQYGNRSGAAYIINPPDGSMTSLPQRCSPDLEHCSKIYHRGEAHNYPWVIAPGLGN
jgi:hypothetical protein